MPTSTDDATGVGIQELLDAGLHFGHQTKRWNPKMKRYIFDKRNGIHVIDLAKSLVLLQEAQKFVYDLVVSGRKVLFVGTKKQAQKVIKDTAVECGQPYVVSRWLGGCLTNNNTIKHSVRRLRELERKQADGTFDTLSKKEVSRLRHELLKLQRNLSGVADMNRMPAAMFVVDTSREAIAVNEANKLKIPVIAMLDTCCDPDPIDYPIPSNDDAIRAIKLVVNTLAATIKEADKEYTKRAAEAAKIAEAEAKAAEKIKAEAKAKALEKAKAAEKAKVEEAKARKKAAKKAAPPKEKKPEAAPAPAKQAPPAEEPEKKEPSVEAAPAEAAAPEAEKAPEAAEAATEEKADDTKASDTVAAE